MGWDKLAAWAAIAVTAASCSGKATGGSEGPLPSQGSESFGVFQVEIGADVSINAQFEEVRAIAGADASAPMVDKTLGTVDGGASQCGAYLEVALSPNDSNADGYVRQNVSAGTITVTGGQGPVALLPSLPDAGLPILYNASGITAFAPGDVITFATHGSEDVPALMLTLPLPDTVTWVSPAASDWAIERSQDLPVAWIGGGETTDFVQVDIEVSTGKQSYTVLCSFPESANGGVVPSSLLDLLPRNTIDLPASATMAEVHVTVANSALQTTDAGWMLSAQANAALLDAMSTVE